MARPGVWVAKRDPVQARILTERVRGVLDDLLGEAAWSPPGDWGRCLVTFPEPGDMVFCHPVMVHCVAPNRGTRPRFMGIRTQVPTRLNRQPSSRNSFRIGHTTGT